MKIKIFRLSFFFLLFFSIFSCTLFRHSGPSLKITKFRHSTLLLENLLSSKKLLINPSKANFSEIGLKREFFNEVIIVIVTEMDEIYLDTTLLRQIKKENEEARIFTTSQIKEFLYNQKIVPERIEIDGKFHEIGDFRIKFIRAFRDADNTYEDTFGVQITAGDTTIYYTGNTGFLEPSSIDLNPPLKFLFSPVAGMKGIMNWKQLADFYKKSGADILIPLNYDLDQQELSLTTAFQKAMRENRVKTYLPKYAIPFE